MESRTNIYARRRHRRELWHRAAILMGALAMSALLAFFLLPPGHANTHSLCRINGSMCLAPPGTKVSDLTRLLGVPPRPGPVLNLTGDVLSIAGGSDAQWFVADTPLTTDVLLTDGAVVVVRHGKPVVEAIKRRVEEIPFNISTRGKGVIVSLAQQGTPGEREIFEGVKSGKQGAAFVVKEPEDTVIERTSTAAHGRKLAALTFDDGPGKYTQPVLDALAANHVPGTFFMLGSSAAANQDLVAKVKEAGHEVENHSWSHPVLTGLDEGEIRSQIARTNDAIGGGRFLRPPYGAYDAVVTAEAAALGLRIVLWTVDTLDWKYPDADSILSRVKAQTGPGAIILMHDGGSDRSATVAAIPLIVDWLFEQGYSLTTVEGLL